MYAMPVTGLCVGKSTREAEEAANRKTSGNTGQDAVKDTETTEVA